jgi:drug/metabolite transporter (DMT)-like permease
MPVRRLQGRDGWVPQAAILVSTLLWGTLWIPVRRLQEAVSIGAWVTTLAFLAPLLVLLPVAVGRGRRVAGSLRRLGLPGLCLALGIALYAEGIVRGQVARVVLLFYLTPVWSTLLARAFLGVPITGRRFGTIVLGFAGMLVIFGGGVSPDTGAAVGEAMGLAGGVAWALAMLGLHRSEPSPVFEAVFVHFLFLGPVFFLVTLVPGGGATAGPDLELPGLALAWLLALGLLWMLPVVWLTVYGASAVEPGPAHRRADRSPGAGGCGARPGRDRRRDPRTAPPYERRAMKRPWATLPAWASSWRNAISPASAPITSASKPTIFMAS